MNGRKKNKQYLVIGILFCLLSICLLDSCGERIYVNEEDCEFYDYADCNTKEPDSAGMLVEVTINTLNPSVPIVVYHGYYDEKDTLFLDTALSAKHLLRLPVNTYYSVLAKYSSPSGVRYALDGDKPGKSRQYVCDSTCWWEKEEKVNLKLFQE
jgi:hypothetical protein